MTHLKTVIASTVIGLILTLTGCEGGMKDMSNRELAAKQDACTQGNPTSPGRVTACENIRKECERRRKDGNFAC